jgi:hypothetical protein
MLVDESVSKDQLGTRTLCDACSVPDGLRTQWERQDRGLRQKKEKYSVTINSEFEALLGG